MKLLLKLLLLLLFIGSIYAVASSYMPVREGSAAVIEEINSGNVISVLTGKRLFVFYRALPWLFNVNRITLENSISHTLVFDIPELRLINDEALKIKLPVSCSFTIASDELKNLNLLKNDGLWLKERVISVLSNSFGFFLQDYVSPFYKWRDISAEKDFLLANAVKEASDKLHSEGILIDDLKYTEAVYFPNMGLYREGLAQAEEIRRISAENSKKLLAVKGNLDINAQSMESTYSVYREMSKIIKENPDILKYIYIDKMADNLKLIISSDKSAVPAFLDSESRDSKAPELNSTGEINNLK